MASTSAATLTRRIAAAGARAGRAAAGSSAHRSFASSSRTADSDSIPQQQQQIPKILPPLLTPKSSTSPSASSTSYQPPSSTSSRCVLISNLPINTRPSDIYRLSDPSSLHRLRDLHSLTFLRTPTLYPTGEAIAEFVTETSARRFQRAIDGSRLSGLHVRATQVGAQRAAGMLSTSVSANLSSQLVHLLLMSQSSGFTVLLRGLPPSLYVSRLHEVLHKGYSLAPPINIRHSRKTIALRSLFDTSLTISQRARQVLARRNDELYRTLGRKRKMGLEDLRASLEEELNERRHARRNGPYPDLQLHRAEEEGLNEEDEDSQIESESDLLSTSSNSSPFAPTSYDGIEGPDLRLDTHRDDIDNPYSYTSFSKVYWDVIWMAAKGGYALRPSGRHQNTEPAASASASAPGFVPFLPITKLPFPAAHGDHHQSRAWFVVRMTDAADAHRLVRRWHNMYYSEKEFGQRYLVEAQVLH
ncbi:hypothetical protein CF326_g9179 [Tilletia indica]|nr:hypothetical protein CF326_g9179 [Tilletia indica]